MVACLFHNSASTLYSVGNATAGMAGAGVASGSTEALKQSGVDPKVAQFLGMGFGFATATLLAGINYKVWDNRIKSGDVGYSRKIFKPGEKSVADTSQNIGKELKNKGEAFRAELDEYIENYKKSSEYMNLSNTQRKKIDRKLLKLKGGNVAVADVDVPGLSKEFKAHSQIDSKDSLGNIGKLSLKPAESERNLTSYVDDDFPRYHDTEAKILEDLSSKIKDTNTKGTITLYSELDCCQSCSNLILEFRRKYPNIDLNVVTNNTLKP